MKGTRLIDIRVGDWCWFRYEWVEYLLSEMRTGICEMTGGVEPTDRWFLETWVESNFFRPFPQSGFTSISPDRSKMLLVAIALG